MSAARPKAANVDEYIAQFPKSTADKLTTIRNLILTAMPGAEEVISYAIPTYKLNDRPVVYFAGYERHVSLYPLPHKAPHEFSEALEPHIAGRGTARFSLDAPLPLDLIKQFIKHKLEEA